MLIQQIHLYMNIAIPQYRIQENRGVNENMLLYKKQIIKQHALFYPPCIIYKKTSYFEKYYLRM